MQKIEREKREKIIKLKKNGYTHKDIAEELNISTKTVQRIIKEAPKTEFNELDTLGYITRAEKKYMDRIKGEKELFEDTEEGWVYHMTAEKLGQETSGLWWKWIAYSESADFDEMVEAFEVLGLETAISPLHSRDFWSHDSPEAVDTETGEILLKKGEKYKAGDRKKAHYHGLTKFSRQVSYKEANRIIREITKGPYIQKCLSLTGSYEYFFHKNNPEKFQYDKDEVTIINGFIIEPTRTERKLMINEVSKLILQEEIENLGELIRYYADQYEYINMISEKSYYFAGLTQSVWRKKHPDRVVKNVILNVDGEIINFGGKNNEREKFL